MSEEAAKAILRAAAPGHFDVVAGNIQKLGNQALCKSNWLTEAQDKSKELQFADIHENDLCHSIANPLLEKLKRYQSDNFLSKPGVSARVAMTSVRNSKSDADCGKLLVHTYAEKIDTSNKFSGNWKATWTIDKVESGVGEISGHVAVRSYAYEDGNVQLKITKEFPPVMVGKVSLEEDEDPSLVDGMVQQIMQWETVILGVLACMNESVTNDHLRSIRRILPITKTKMNWDAVAHRSVKTLKKTAPETRSKVKYNS